jgi:hypothetical protein
VKTYGSGRFGQTLLSDLIGLEVINRLINLDIGSLLNLPRRKDSRGYGLAKGGYNYWCGHGFVKE